MQMTDMDFNQSCELPCSGTTDIAQLVNTSNVGTPGLWIFRIDGENIIPASPNEGMFYTLVSHNANLFTVIVHV